MEIKRCANCARSLKLNKVIWDGGKLKSGGEICGKCWNTLVEMDFSLGQKAKEMSLEEVVYKLSSFKKTVYRKLFDAKLLSEDNDRIISGVQHHEEEHTNRDGGHKNPENCAQCLKNMEGKKIFLGLGKLKTGEQICEGCWLFLSRLDSSMSNRMKEFSLAEVKKIFTLVQSRSSRKEMEAMTEEKPEALAEAKPEETADTCPLCQDVHTPNNEVAWGLSMMKSGEKLCLGCWRAVSKIDPWVGNHMEQRSLDEIKKMMGLELTPAAPAEIETVTEKTSDASEVTGPVADVVVETIYAMPETKQPEVNTFANRSEARLAAIGITRQSYPELWLVKELEELETLLTEEERVLAALKGTYGKEPAALIATSERFILLSKKTFGGDVAEVYKLSWILAVESIVVGTLSDVTFSLSANVIKLMDVDRERAASFCDAIKPMLGK